MNKICTKCLQEKPATSEFFPKSASYKSGFGSWCKQCHKDNKNKPRIPKKPKIIKIPQSYIDVDGFKDCNICKETKPMVEFVKEKGVGQKTTKACKACRDRASQYYYDNIETQQAYARQYRSDNKEYYSDYFKNWKSDNKNHTNAYAINKYNEDARHKAILVIGSAPRRMIRSVKESGSKKVIEILGCYKTEFIRHIESMFHNGMTWENYRILWEYDHHFPLSMAYDCGEEVFLMASRFHNVRPHLIDKNVEKGYKIPKDNFITKFLISINKLPIKLEELIDDPFSLTINSASPTKNIPTTHSPQNHSIEPTTQLPSSNGSLKPFSWDD